MHARPEVLLFDLGRVLIDINFDRCFAAWAHAAGMRPEAVRERFVIDKRFQDHERGKLSCEAFFAGVSESIGLGLAPETTRRGWNAIFGPEVDGIRARLLRLRDSYRLYALSNTNVAHAEHFQRQLPEMLDTLHGQFLSHELGLRKPDAAIYAHVVEAVGVAPEAILFLDDSPRNLRGAERIGMRTQLVRDPRHTCELLDAIS